MTQREAFEAWALRDYPHGNIQWDRDTPFRAQSAGAVAYAMYSEWHAWQASAARYEAVVGAARAACVEFESEDFDYMDACDDARKLRQALAALDGAE